MFVTDYHTVLRSSVYVHAWELTDYKRNMCVTEPTNVRTAL